MPSFPQLNEQRQDLGGQSTRGVYAVGPDAGLPEGFIALGPNRPRESSPRSADVECRFVCSWYLWPMTR